MGPNGENKADSCWTVKCGGKWPTQSARLHGWVGEAYAAADCFAEVAFSTAVAAAGGRVGLVEWVGGDGVDSCVNEALEEVGGIHSSSSAMPKYRSVFSKRVSSSEVRMREESSMAQRAMSCVSRSDTEW